MREQRWASTGSDGKRWVVNLTGSELVHWKCGNGAGFENEHGRDWTLTQMILI
jgi:hypothetical protein